MGPHLRTRRMGGGGTRRGRRVAALEERGWFRRVCVGGGIGYPLGVALRVDLFHLGSVTHSGRSVGPRRAWPDSRARTAAEPIRSRPPAQFALSELLAAAAPGARVFRPTPHHPSTSPSHRNMVSPWPPNNPAQVQLLMSDYFSTGRRDFPARVRSRGSRTVSSAEPGSA